MHRIILLLLLVGWSSTGSAQTSNGDRIVAEAILRDRVVLDAATTSLRAELERLIQGAGWPNDRWSVLVVSLDRGDTIYSHSPDLMLAPASNVKLFTSAAALYYLGPHFRFNTFLLADGAVRDSVLEGNLVVYGTGDPTIAGRFGRSTSVWEAFADSLLSQGIRQVTGDVVGDASYFRGPGTGQGWQDSYIDAAYAAPASALTYAENIATLRIRPAAQAGWRPEVTLVPGGDGIGIVNQANTVAQGATTIRVFRSSYGGPLMVHGQIPQRSPGVLRAVPVSDPARYAAAVFREVLQSRGITVLGEVRSVEREEDSAVTARSVFAPAFDRRTPVRVLAIHNSPPLQQILEVVNKRSHNLLSEQVLRAMGRVAVGEGSVEGGIKAVRHMLEREGGGESLELELFDGSGLSSLNRASARTFIQLLSLMHHSPMWESFWATLPETGARDGLRRMGRTAADGKLRAKTGTINNVSALSGYVQAANGERLAFSIVSNNVPSTWRAKRIEDAMGVRLASFTRPLLLAEGPPTATPEDATSVPVAAPPESIITPPPTPRAAAPPRSVERASGGARTHVVRQGQTLDAIAREYGVTVAAVQAANPQLEPRRLLVGATVRIPETGEGETTRSEPARASPTHYTIRKGDTLEGIAKKHDTTVAALEKLNPGLNPRRLIPGKSVRIR
jgi:D-alanyl-D-alanine carboxypeptidase/D-alanyl-D-alanine-endopeptidase (penicillin-binding protein 4)